MQASEESIEIAPSGIAADLVVPESAKGVVIFAHGSGSSRFSSRNRFVAGELQRAGFGTLLLDLLTAREEEIDLRTRHLRFDIDLLATRLMEATNWAGTNREIYNLPVAYFGASTGAAAALISAANLPENVKAVVSRGGRPDLAASALSRVRAPTLLILGGKDTPVIDLNRKALDELQCEKELKIVPGASHLFEEPGTLEQVSSLASEVINNIQQQAIRNLAYELWQQRGCRQGSPEEDWYRAEQILQAARTQSALGSR